MKSGYYIKSASNEIDLGLVSVALGSSRWIPSGWDPEHNGAQSLYIEIALSINVAVTEHEIVASCYHGGKELLVVKHLENATDAVNKPLVTVIRRRAIVELAEGIGRLLMSNHAGDLTEKG